MSGTGDQMKQKGQEAFEQAKEAGQQVASTLADQVREQASTRLEGQKDRATHSLENVAQAFRQTGQQLREKDQAAVADYTDKAAEQMERLVGYLQGQDIDQLVGDVENFARRQPALFIGGALALGILAARFLKSSSQQGSTMRDYGYAPNRGQQGSYGGYGTRGYGTPSSAPGRSGMGSGTGGWSTPTGARPTAFGSGTSTPGGQTYAPGNQPQTPGSSQTGTRAGQPPMQGSQGSERS
jgi:hypothetical protein